MNVANGEKKKRQRPQANRTRKKKRDHLFCHLFAEIEGKKTLQNFLGATKMQHR